LVVRPGDAGEVAAVMSCCHGRGVPIIPRGGGTGLVGGSLDFTGGVVVDLARINQVTELRPDVWRMTVGAGLTTRHVHRLARESGLYFPPDPGAAEESQIGGNIATNAGGPHAFKYGTTAAWVLGLEVVVPPGTVIEVGGRMRKDVAGYDFVRLFAGSEGTLGLITGCTLRLIPYPEARHTTLIAFRDVVEGCAGLESVLGSGLVPAAVEYLDRGAIDAARRAFPGALHHDAGFLLIVELDGSTQAVAEAATVLGEAVGPSLQVDSRSSAEGQAALWRWRDTITGAVCAQLGGKLSVDVCVPAECFPEALELSSEIAASAGLDYCGWGHAGDANLHSTFVFDPGRDGALEAAERAADLLLEAVVELGGSIAAEHGIGWAKRGHLALQLDPVALDLQRGLKRLFDPKGLLNPGKKC
jgi:glycolate oxidase subunit GlcD